MGKAAKEHRRKVQARNGRINQQKEKVQKMQKDFIMNLIKQEQEKGLFDNAQAGPMSGPMVSGPMIGGGPLSFDGDLLTFDGPTLGGPVADIIDIPVVDESIVQPEDEQRNENDL